LSAQADLPAYLREIGEGCSLAIRVQTGAKSTAIVGFYGEGESVQLKIALQAPPVDGRANAALIGFLAETFHIPKGSITILAGLSGRSKVCLLRSLPARIAQQMLAAMRDAED